MFFNQVKLNLEKKISALNEGVVLDDFLLSQNFELKKIPFPHVVIDNFFKNDVYNDLVSYFKNCLEKGLSEEMDKDRFHPFLNLKGEMAYDGYVRTPRFGENKTFDLFYTAEWNLFFSRMFKQQTDWFTSVAMHHHPAGNKTGFVHSDYASKKFLISNKLNNGVIPYEMEKDDKNVNLITGIRIISIIYYLNNDDWQWGDGGETAFYKTKDGVTLKLVEPINNRLLAFQISPTSLHAFQENFKPRSSIVQWFHTDPEWCKKKFGFVK